MFGDFVEATVGETGRKNWAVAVSMIVQIVALVMLLLVPILFTQALPGILGLRGALDAPVPLADAPKPVVAATATVKPGVRLLDGNILREPISIPAHPVIFDEPPLPPELPVADNGGAGVWNLLGTLGERPTEAPQPVAPVVIQRIRQSEIEQAMILAQPQPVYPPLARSARIQGNVVLRAIIDREGRVAELQVVSGHPVLAQAALNAVRSWRYRPTLLNGEPVEVETTITVSFVLGG